MDHAAQARVAGHVDAVVIPGAEVDGGEGAIFELRGQFGVTAHQRLCAVTVALGLEDLVFFDGAELADGTVHRADKGRAREWSCAGLERPGEKFVEGGVTAWVRVRRLGHVDAVTADEPGDHPARPPGRLRSGAPAGEHGQCPFGQQVLQNNSRG
ncbi:hypothetical protein D9M68_803750 [compost metagenome]